MLVNVLAILGGLLVLAVVAELLARRLGLGNPPLWQADPEIEYLPRPSQQCRRFGNRVNYNAWSMRSGDFPKEKEDPNELRVLVVGDSVVNGGAEVDQSDLATSIVQRRLRDAMRRPVVVGNIAAGSWGPPNELAYLKRFGLFDADLLVIVVNSADYNDAPTFAPLTKARPQSKPRFALQELLDKYGRRFLRAWKRDLLGRRDADPADVARCLGALAEMIRLGRERGAEVIVAQHLKRSEIQGDLEPGYHEIARTVREEGLEPLDLGPAFAGALADGADPYHGDIHPTTRGQHVLALALLEPLRKALARRIGAGLTAADRAAAEAD